MNSSVNSVPVEVQGTTNQINNMLIKMQERDNTIERYKEIAKKYEEAASEFNNIQSSITELKKANKEERKLVEMLVDYVKNNYGYEFNPGSFFNQEEITEEVEQS